MGRKLGTDHSYETNRLRKRIRGNEAKGLQNMTEHNLFKYPYTSFTNKPLPPLKVVALYFDKLDILDPVGTSWDTIGADYGVEAVKQFHDEGILKFEYEHYGGQTLWIFNFSRI